MNDLLLHPAARTLVGALGLPFPMPARLRRDAGPWQERSLSGRITVIGAAPSAECLAPIAIGLAPAGAVPYLAVPADLASAYRVPEPRRALAIEGKKVDPAEAKSRATPALDALGEIARIDALVFDATGITKVASLRSLYDFFHPLLARLEPTARVVVVARSEAGEDGEAVAAQTAIHGFVKSLAKELGKAGTTANLIRVSRGAEDRLGPVLRFVLSGRAAFVTSQAIDVTARARAAADVPLLRPLDHKIALVTGAARGIGEAAGRLLALEGAHVICVDHPEGGAAVSDVAGAIGGTALLVDLVDAAAPSRIADAIRARGGVDVVVHNAGITRDKTLARMSTQAWDEVLDVNLAAAIRITTAIEDQVRDGGRIVCLASLAGIAGNAGQTAYAASKAGIAGYARELGERLAGRGITVNAIAPGFIETRLTAAMPIALRQVARRLSALAQGGLPDDVAQAVVFLASPGAHGITCSTLRICGGSFLGG